MPLTPAQTLITILAVALGTAVTRFTPFLLFPEGKSTPKIIEHLGKILPPAMLGLLIVYCLKDVSFSGGAHGLPELLSIAAVVLLHRWKSNTLLSIAGGTALYMLLVQTVFI